MGLLDFLTKLFGGGDKKQGKFHTKVVGTTFEGRQETIGKYCKVGMAVILRRDKGNKHDKSAIGVWVQTGITQQQIGFIPSGTNQRLARDMDGGKQVSAQIKNMTGGTKGKPTRGVNLEISVR